MAGVAYLESGSLTKYSMAGFAYLESGSQIQYSRLGLCTNT